MQLTMPPALIAEDTTKVYVVNTDARGAAAESAITNLAGAGTGDAATVASSGNCVAGRYGFALGTIKVCALCRAGTTSGAGAATCAPCVNGKAGIAGVGKNTESGCTGCLAGTYAAAARGDSVCLPW